MKRLFYLSVIFCAMVFLAFATVASAQPQAICVPWQPSSPTIAHFTYSGADITLKGIARGGATTYTWDFGDGSPLVLGTISDPYNLGVKHIYVGAVGSLFVATLTVSDGTDTHQDTYPVMIYESSDLSNPDHLDVRINMAIDEGLWYLHTNMNRATYGSGSPGYDQPYGYWLPSYFPLAATGAAVDAFQLHGSKANTDYGSDPYVETVQRALNYILAHTYSYSIGVQLAGDPDTNGNGIGLVANHTSNLYDVRQTYIGGICMVALASSGAPNRVASVGGTTVYGRTYADIVQDMVDFFAWGQVDENRGVYRGGWRYYANYSSSDMSTTQWPPLGMMAAEENMGSTVPQFVRDELIYFLDYTQHTACDNDNGVFGYHIDGYFPNCTKAGAGIICHEFLGTPLTDPKVESAIGFLYRHWNDTGGSWDYQRLLGNSYGMYAAMKAMRIPEPDITHITDYDCTIPEQMTNSFDWYYPPNTEPREGLAHYIVRTQQSDGSWDDVPGPNPVYDEFSTGWRVLILLKGVATIPPKAVICDCDEQEYNLDQDIQLNGACSYHPDITRHIVSYEWDLDDNGTFEATGGTQTIAGGFSSTGYYPVTLKVTDDNPEGAQTSIYTCQIYVHPPPHCPHAFANGPYIGWVGTPVTFDASASWDPDNEIVSYEWDLDNDGEFDDAVGINPQWTWSDPYFGVIGLRVTDAAGDYDACSDIDYSTVEIGNHAPVSDPNGPYQGAPGYTVHLDGSGSYDLDPDDEITCTWDIDNDGEFDDATGCEADLPVPSDAPIDYVYDICLKVTDSHGETDITCTTVTVVPNQPPVAMCKDVTISANENCQADADIDDGSYDPDGDELVSQQSPEGPYELGDTEVTLTVTDPFGESDSCIATVTVVDDIPPEILCNAPETIVPPDAPISFTATATDNCDVSVEITEYDCYTYTKKGKRIDKTESCIVDVAGDTITILDSGGVDDHITWTIRATDSSGNTSEELCEIYVVNPAQ